MPAVQHGACAQKGDCSMCSRYNLTSPHEAVRAYFGYENRHEFPPRYNIAPTDPAAIVRPAHNGRRELWLVRWGLIPSWVKDPQSFSTLINAREETILEKPSFRGGIRHKRCLVPATGFYEWTGPRGAKQPHHIHRSQNENGAESAGALMAFAGIYDEWLGADGSEIDTMAIITVAANRTLQAIHDRMPAILAPADFDAWLDVKGVEAREAVELLRPADDNSLAVTEVSRAVNSPRAEGVELIEPVGDRLL